MKKLIVLLHKIKSLGIVLLVLIIGLKTVTTIPLKAGDLLTVDESGKYKVIPFTHYNNAKEYVKVVLRVYDKKGLAKKLKAVGKTHIYFIRGPSPEAGKKTVEDAELNAGDSVDYPERFDTTHMGPGFSEENEALESPWFTKAKKTFGKIFIEELDINEMRPTCISIFSVSEKVLYQYEFCALSKEVYEWYLKKTREKRIINLDVHDELITEIVLKFPKKCDFTVIEFRNKIPDFPPISDCYVDKRIEKNFFIIKGKSKLVLIWNWDAFPDENFIMQNFLESEGAIFYKDSIGLLWAKKQKRPKSVIWNGK